MQRVYEYITQNTSIKYVVYRGAMERVNKHITKVLKTSVQPKNVQIMQRVHEYIIQIKNMLNHKLPK